MHPTSKKMHDVKVTAPPVPGPPYQFAGSCKQHAPRSCKGTGPRQRSQVAREMHALSMLTKGLGASGRPALYLQPAALYFKGIQHTFDRLFGQRLGGLLQAATVWLFAWLLAPRKRTRRKVRGRDCEGIGPPPASPPSCHLRGHGRCGR